MHWTAWKVSYYRLRRDACRRSWSRSCIIFASVSVRMHFRKDGVYDVWSCHCPVLEDVLSVEEEKINRKGTISLIDLWLCDKFQPRFPENYHWPQHFKGRAFVCSVAVRRADAMRIFFQATVSGLWHAVELQRSVFGLGWAELCYADALWRRRELEEREIFLQEFVRAYCVNDEPLWSEGDFHPRLLLANSVLGADTSIHQSCGQPLVWFQWGLYKSTFHGALRVQVQSVMWSTIFVTSGGPRCLCNTFPLSTDSGVRVACLSAFRFQISVEACRPRFRLTSLI